LSLFSSKVSDLEKKGLLQKLMTYKPSTYFANRHSTGFGKPVLTKIREKAKLSDFVGPSSWYFIELLDIELTFLSVSVHQWNTNHTYREAEEKVTRLTVVNDAAERGVKLTQDFLESSKSEARFQNVLQVVEQHWQQQPNQRSNTKKSFV